jgi:hypothetical protein
VSTFDSGNRPALENPTARSRITFLLLFAVLVPPIVAFGILYRQALSVPYQDDYDAILAFAVDYDQLPTLRAKALDIATRQHNDYKLAFEHLIVAAEMELTGQLNFALLGALGNLFLLPIWYLLWRTYERKQSGLDRRLLEFVPISLLFFSLVYWESLDWAMAGLQNLPVILFSFLAVYLLIPRELVRPTRAHLLFACLAAVLAACSSANGFLLGPLGLLILLPRRAYAESLAWCVSFVLPLAAYLYHYAPYHPPVYGRHTALFLSRPFYFLAFLGCAVPFRWPAALLGFVILGIIALAIRSRFDRINPAVFYFSLWIVGTGFLVAWLRGAIASRYSIYSILLLIFCYSFLAQYLPTRLSILNGRRFYVASVVLTGAFCFMADLSGYVHLGRRRRMVLSGFELYRAKPEVNSPMVDPLLESMYPGEKESEQEILNRAIQKNIYALPPQPELR